MTQIRARAALLPILLTTALPMSATAEVSNTILVLDGSGSMWGQIDGVNKIVIARDVVGELLDGFPSDQNLGLTVYGHRERGNCADIETVVAPGAGTVSAIRDAVNGINPRGKTPMTDAVIAAAEALRYTEEKATVILVSDGIETCNPDPCAAAAALEQAGIDFTAHVIGFDVTDPEALAQMQCLADETGGTFRAASDAAELSEALTTVAVAPEPEPVVPSEITFEARLEDEDGPLVEGPVLWSFDPMIENVGDDEEGNSLTFSMEQGSYEATAYWVVTEDEQTRQFIVGANPRTVTIVFEPPAQSATITAPGSATAGSAIEVGWNGPNAEGDYIGIGAVDATGAGQWENFAYTETGTPLDLLVPIGEGDYVIGYFLGDGRQLIGTAPITLTLPEVAMTAPAQAIAGSTIEIDWTGPNYQNDYIGIGKVDAEGADRWENFSYTRDGSPLDLLVPTQPGDYLILYFTGQDRVALSQAAITVSETVASVIAPATATAGDTIEIGWTGPNNDNDYIGIGRVGAEGASAWENFTYTREGDPVSLLMPTEAGDYVIQYFLAQDRTPIASASITLEATVASVTAPTDAVAGSTIEVMWTGPDNDNDYIGIGLVGATGAAAWENFVYTRDGSPLDLQVPIATGDYIIQYYLAQDRTPIASQALTVSAVTATVSGPASAPAGSPIDVSWTGPDYRDDYIGIGKVGASGGARWENFAYTRDGTTLTIEVPPTPGDYVISYYAGQGRTELVSVPLTATPVSATLSAPATAAAGSEIEIGWTGPDYRDDYVGIGLEGATGGGQWQSFAYTRDGSPAKLTVPQDPGNYVIKYFIGQDRYELTSVPLAVE